MSRVPLRVRLTAAFAVAMLLVLAGSALFVYARLRADLNESVDAEVRARVDSGAVAARPPSGRGIRLDRVAEPEESFVQVLNASGRVLADTTGTGRPALGAAETARASARGIELERRVATVEGSSRLVGTPVTTRNGRLVVVGGVSLQDRDDTLRSVLISFLIGGAGAVLLASLAGYGLAGAGLRPIEAMRRRAELVSLDGGRERLPLPAARDEVRRLGGTLNDMLGRLQDSFERERSFVADASHELRTPLAVVKTDLETALRSEGLSPPARDALASAVEEVDGLAQLAEDLLLIARASDGHLAIRAEPVDLDELLQRTVERFSDRGRDRGRIVRVERPVARSACLDPLHARQALGNLVDNALRHGAGEVVISAREREGRLEIDVSDGGAGFSDPLSGRAFERFAREDGPPGRGGGAGLGLAIVASIAQAHGGSATIVAGAALTTVRLSLPVDSTAPQSTL